MKDDCHKKETGAERFFPLQPPMFPVLTAFARYAILEIENVFATNGRRPDSAPYLLGKGECL